MIYNGDFYQLIRLRVLLHNYIRQLICVMTTIMLMPWILSWHDRIIPAHLWVQCKVSQVWPWEGEKQHCQGNRPDNALPWEDQAKRWISHQFHVFTSNAHQRFTDTRGLDEADGDAVLAKHSEVEHGKADSSKEEAVFCKELESFHWEEKTNWMQWFHENLCALPSDRVRSRSFLFHVTPPLLAHLQIGWGC